MGGACAPCAMKLKPGGQSKGLFFGETTTGAALWLRSVDYTGTWATGSPASADNFSDKYLNPLPNWCEKENDFKSHRNV